MSALRDGIVELLRKYDGDAQDTPYNHATVRTLVRGLWNLIIDGEAGELNECDRCNVTHDATELQELAGVRLRAEGHRPMRACADCVTELAELGARLERGLPLPTARELADSQLRQIKCGGCGASILAGPGDTRCVACLTPRNQAAFGRSEGGSK